MHHALDSGRSSGSSCPARSGTGIILNGVPTGVAVCDAMHDGGPWPANPSPPRTSVGACAVDRFLRPVALHGFPHEPTASRQVSRTFM